MSPAQLLDIARKTGLRQLMHAVPPAAARLALARFVAALDAARAKPQPLTPHDAAEVARFMEYLNDKAVLPVGEFDAKWAEYEGRERRPTDGEKAVHTAIALNVFNLANETHQ